MLCCGATVSKVHRSNGCMKNFCHTMINIYILSIISYNILFSQCLTDHIISTARKQVLHMSQFLWATHMALLRLWQPSIQKIYFRNTVNSQKKKIQLTATFQTQWTNWISHSSYSQFCTELTKHTWQTVMVTLNKIWVSAFLQNY